MYCVHDSLPLPRAKESETVAQGLPWCSDKSGSSFCVIEL